MAKPTLSRSSPEVESLVVVMRRIAPERFEVLTGTIKGPLLNARLLESNVSLVVGRGTARRAVEKQKALALAQLGLSADN